MPAPSAPLAAPSTRSQDSRIEVSQGSPTTDSATRANEVLDTGVQDNKLFVAFLDEVGGPEPECFVDGLPKDILPELANCKQHLTEAQYEILVALVREFPDIFCRDGEEITTLKDVCVRLNMPPDATPVATRGRRLNHIQMAVLIEYVTKLEKQKVIERIHDTEGWLNQILFVKKPNGSLRPCLNLRRTVNSKARPLVSSLPYMQDCVDTLAGSKYMTIQDAKAAYWQLLLHPEDRKYTAFPSPLGTYAFTRAVMGWTSAQQEWINAMDTVLGDLQ